MRPTRILIASLTVLVAFLAWMVLQRQSHSQQILSTPTALPKAEFVLNFPQKAVWENYLNVSVEAPAGTTCELIYMTPSGIIHKIDTTANDKGLCEGRWKIEEAEGKGTGRLNFKIGDFSKTHFIEVRPNF